MTDIENLLLIIAVAVIVVWALLRRKGSAGTQDRHNGKTRHRAGGSAPANKLKKLRQNGNFRGVEIKNGKCQAALRLAGKQFPIDNVPLLPLQGCTASQCTCTYAGMSEHRNQAPRRSQHERRDAIRFDAEHSDRRSHKDRRRDVNTWKDRG